MKNRISCSIMIESLIVLMLLITIPGCAGLGTAPDGATPQTFFKRGYLETKALPNSLALLPPPPAEGSTAFTLDREIAGQARVLKDSPRWKQAIADADLRTSQAPANLSCALNAPITEKDTPRLYMLMKRMMADTALSTYTAKNYYKRTRPFVVNRETSCTPEAEKHLSTNGSYPSGHTTIGWAWALILTEIAPDRADAILQRGRAFGESRVVCGVHWQSDVTAGMVIGAGTVARLHADPAFRADLEAAKAELAAVRAKGLQPTRDCQAEKAALSIKLFR